MRRSGEFEVEIAHLRRQERATRGTARARRGGMSTRHFRRCSGSQSLPCLHDNTLSPAFSPRVANLRSVPRSASAIGGLDGHVSEEDQLGVRGLLQHNTSDLAAASSGCSDSNRTKKPNDVLCAEEMIFFSQTPTELICARPLAAQFCSAGARPQSAPAATRNNAFVKHKCVRTHH